MHHERLITGVAGVFAAFAVVLTVVAIAGSPVALPVALAFAVAAALMYDQLSGRMAARVYRRVERRARANAGGGRARVDGQPRGRGHSTSAGAGPREAWEPPRGGQRARDAARGVGRTRRRTDARRKPDPGPSPADLAAYDTLGVEPDADDEAVRAAYRERVKEVHPDSPEGNRERFKAVQDAYEQVTD